MGGLVEEGRARAEHQNRVCKCFIQRQRLLQALVSSHSALIDRKFQEGIGFSSCMLPRYRFQEHGALQECEGIKEKVQHVLHVVCW